MGVGVLLGLILVIVIVIVIVIIDVINIVIVIVDVTGIVLDILAELINKVLQPTQTIQLRCMMVDLPLEILETVHDDAKVLNQ